MVASGGRRAAAAAAVLLYLAALSRGTPVLDTHTSALGDHHNRHHCLTPSHPSLNMPGHHHRHIAPEPAPEPTLQLKYANVWGASVKHRPQKVGKDHVLQDEDIVQVRAALSWAELC